MSGPFFLVIMDDYIAVRGLKVYNAKRVDTQKSSLASRLADLLIESRKGRSE